MKKTILLFSAAVLAVASIPSVQAVSVYAEGFEDPSWVAGMPGNWQNYRGATIERVTSGTDGINSSVGNAHARIGNTANADRGPFTFMGGYRDQFGTGFDATLDIYLDPTWSNNLGFDYSVAVNDQTGANLRDFIFNVGVVDGALLVNASNSSYYTVNPNQLLNENMGMNYTVTTAGWYTFKHKFYDLGGVLAVDFDLLNSSGTNVYSITRSTSTDLISTVVGGNRYGWLVYDDIEGLAIDANGLLATSPLPGVPEGGATVAMFGMALGAIGLLRRKYRA